MQQPDACPRCRGPMEPGYILDRTHHHSAKTQKWVEGAPDQSFWWGLKTQGHETHPVHTFRCERCGYLESYANAE